MRRADTTEDFIRKARKVHGNKYDYSKTEYKCSHDKVCIICPEHGEFWQRPNTHLRGSGCQECAGCKRIDTESFIERARKVHGDKFDYSKVKYNGYHRLVKIICPEHGEFMMTPCGHLVSKTGCPGCSENELHNCIGRFIRKARSVHGSKYDYSKVEYKDANTSVCIVCPEHGEFWQNPASHLRGVGCIECYREKIQRENGLNFIRKALELYGDKYDYSCVEYVSNSVPVDIVCKIHGKFRVRPSSFLAGHVCHECSVEMDTNEFIEKANEIHGDKYDYSKVRVDGKSNVCITCPEHGEYLISPSLHLNGFGCPKCRKRITHIENVQRTKSKSASGKYGVCDVPGAKRLYPIQYRKWRSMIRRCYSDYCQKHNLCYAGCSVCDEWLLFSNFKKWCDENWNGDSKIHLDKDLLVRGNKVYGPDTCCFVPQTLNSLIVGFTGEFNGEIPNGIRKVNVGGGVYKYRIAQKKYHHSEMYNTVDDALASYNKLREDIVHNKAQEYFDSGEISENVYHALMEWKIV